MCLVKSIMPNRKVKHNLGSKFVQIIKIMRENLIYTVECVVYWFEYKIDYGVCNTRPPVQVRNAEVVH